MGNRELAKEEGLESFTIEEYVASMQDFPNLVDKINKKEDGTGGFGKKFLFPEHLAPVQLNSGLKSGRLLQGIFYLSRTNFLEEFMLAANISAAKRIYEAFPDCAMLRRHPAPPPSNFDPLVKAARQQGYHIEVDSGKQLADSLNAASDPARPYMNTMLRMITTRCMMQAVYFASGTIEEPLFQHYGLACPIYTHFTSPIRRYADVIVHRLLAVSINADSTYADLVDKKHAQKIAENINYRHRMAQYASRASVNLYTHIYFLNRLRDETGYILFIRQNAVQLLIPKYGLEGTLFLRSTSKQKSSDLDWIFDEEEPSQTCGDVKLTLFMKLTVQVSLDTSDVQHEKLAVRLVHPNIEGFSVPPAPKGEKREAQKEEEGEKAKRVKS